MFLWLSLRILVGICRITSLPRICGGVRTEAVISLSTKIVLWEKNNLFKPESFVDSPIRKTSHLGAMSTATPWFSVPRARKLNSSRKVVLSE